NTIKKLELTVPSYNNIGASFIEEYNSKIPIEKNENIDLLDSAEKYFKTAIKLDSNYYGSYFNLGNLHNLKNNLDSAIFYTLKATKIRPKDSSYLGTLSYIYHRNGDFIKSDSTLNMAMEIRPLNPYLYSFYIYLGHLNNRENQ